MRFITAVLAISPGILFAGVILAAAAPGLTQASTEAEQRDQQQGQDQKLRGGGGGGIPNKRKLPSINNELPGMGRDAGGGGGDVPAPDQKPEARQLSGKVIISRKSAKKLQKEGKAPAEIVQIRAQGKSEINMNRVVFTSGGDEDDDEFQVIEVGRGQEASFINSIKNDPYKSSLYSYVEEDYIEVLDRSTNDPQLATQWHHTNMQSYEAWDIEMGSENVTIGICDTGLQGDHPDLMGNVLEGYYAINQEWGGDTSPVHPHGTNCAGCAAAMANNGVGVSGAAWNVKHRPGRVSDRSSGSGDSAHIADCAKKMCEKADVKVVSVSYSGAQSLARKEAATHCKNHGALMINSAGNNNNYMPGIADDDDIIVVGATDINDNKSSFSNHGPFVDLWAPGTDVHTTTWGSAYGKVSGTSFACPLVAGLVALIWSKNPGLTPDEVEAILKESTDNVGNLANYETAYGRVNSFKAVSIAGSGTPFPTNAPTTPPPFTPPTGPTPPPTAAVAPTITAHFDADIGAPRCTDVGGACTSGSLLNSRGTLFPSEDNGPNTIDNCLDGNMGNYLADESNEALEVYALHGGLLEVGKMAVAKATVWAWSDGSYDTADFYVSDTVSTTPNWVHIGSVKPTHGATNDLESDPFVLTSNFQAVRVNYRWGSFNKTCSTGGYDDTDDLVFTVAPAATPPPTPNPTTAAPITPNPTMAAPTTPNPTMGATLPTTPNPTPPPTTCVETTIEIQTEEHPDHTSWILTDLCSGETVLRGSVFLIPEALHSVTYCLPPAQYQFVIIDAVGDGMTGSGYYKVISDGVLVTEGNATSGFERMAFENFGTCIA